jgi:GDP-L-fucose synthase
MKILLLGSTGLLGNSISNSLLRNKDYTILAPSRSQLDASNVEALRNYLFQTEPDTIINCAARVGGLYSQINYPASYLHENILVTDSLYEATRLSHSSAFIINFLSTCCFPATVDYPISPNQLHNGPPHHTNSSYSYAKRMIDVYAQSYYREYGISSTTFVLGNLFGKHDHFSDPQNAHVIPSLIAKAHAAVQSRENSFEILGDGSPLREFLYADDAAECISLFLKTFDRLQKPNLLLFSNPNEISILELAKIIGKIASPSNPLAVKQTSVESQGQARKPSQTSVQLLQLFKPEMFTPFEHAIMEVYSFYETNYAS